jgi:hypothetical protein
VLVAVLASILWAVAADGAAATKPVTYYVSSTGRDPSSGRSRKTAWRTLARASATSFKPGDRLLLQGGATFAGPLTFGSDDRGSRALPVKVGSYGRGRATVVGGAERGVFAYNTAGLTIEDLDVTGPGPDRSQRDGILFYTDRPSGLLSGVIIRNVEISGFGHAGVAVGSWDGRAGFRNVRIERVTSHSNGRTGIHSYAQVPRAHRDVRITRSRAYGNEGVPGLPFNSGSGLALGGVEQGRIDRSMAYDNGGRDTAAEGPVGIWTYDSSRVTIEHNRSYRNRTGGPADGGGFDLDQNTSNSVLQFNVSSGNYGAGFLSANGPNTLTHQGNVIRRNVSEDDGRRHGYGGIQVWRRSAGLRIERNRVTLSSTPSDSPAVLLYELPAPTPAAGPVTFRGNVFMTSRGAPLVRLEASSPEGVRLKRNAYSTSGGPFRVDWNGARYGSLGEWRAATGQEVSTSSAQKAHRRRVTRGPSDLRP